MNLSKELKRQAVSLGLCQEWTEGWGNPDKDELVQKYLNGIDFCIGHNYPSNEFIKQYFGEIAERNGVFTDTDIHLENIPLLVLNGACTGEVELNGYTVGTIYIRHDSEVRIIVKDYAIAFIRLYDKAKIWVESESRAFVYQYGGCCEGTGNIKVRDRMG